MKNKYLLLFFISLFKFAATAQSNTATIEIQVPTTFCDYGVAVPLQAIFPRILPAASQSYSAVTAPTYQNYPYSGGTQLQVPPGGTNMDDFWSAPITLPFQFDFYGNTYRSCQLSSNGVLSFDPGNTTGAFSDWLQTGDPQIPSPAFQYPNAIYCIYSDLDFTGRPATSDINYIILDQGPYAAPNRAFVFNINGIPNYRAGDPNNVSGLQTAQVILHETTNAIEINVQRRVGNPLWENGVVLAGLQNASGTAATTLPGMNVQAIAPIINQSFVLTPNGADTNPSSTQFHWEHQDTSGNVIIDSTSPTFSPVVTGPITYTAVVTYVLGTGANVRSVRLEDSITLSTTPTPIPGFRNPVNYCYSGLPGFTADPAKLDQTTYMLQNNPTPANYVVTYFKTEQGAINQTPSQRINPNNFVVTNQITDVWVRVVNRNGADCPTYSHFQITPGPRGQFDYSQNSYLNNISTPQPIVETSPLTPGGTYTATPPGLTIDATTGAVTPSTSTVGNYNVLYHIDGTTYPDGSANCPSYDATLVAVEILEAGCTAVAPLADQTVCPGLVMPSMTYTATGATNITYTGTLPPGVTGSFLAPVFTVSGTPTAPTGTTAATYNFTVNIVTPAGNCSVVSSIVVNPKPTVLVAFNDLEICEDGSTTVKADIGTSTVAYNYAWTVPTGVTPPGNVANFTTDKPGIYKVTITDPLTGCVSDEATGTLIVNLKPVVNSVDLTLAAICNDGTTTTSVSANMIGSPAGTYTYAWTVPAGFTNPGNVASFTTNVAGAYSVIVTSNKGCTSIAKSATLTVNTLPTGVINGNDICAGASTSLSAVVNSPDPAATYSYTWTVPGPVPPGNVDSFTTSTPGLYTVQITNDLTSCVSVVISKTITASPIPVFEVALSAAAICTNDPVTVSAVQTGTLVGPFTYVWTVPTGVTDPGDVASFTLPSGVAGTYSVVATNTASGCASLIKSKTLTVNPLPDLTAVNIANAEICAGGSTVVSAQVTTPGSYSYAWTLPTGATAVGNVASFNATVAGTYSVVVTNTLTTCVSAPQSASLIVNPIPAAILTPGVLAICENATPKPTVTLTGSNGTIPYTFSYTINGTAYTKPSDPGLSTTTVEIDTNVPGSFVVVLTGVSDNTTTACASGPITGQTATIKVNPSLTGSVTSSIAEVCQNATLLPQIVFTGDGGTGPYNFTYTINGGTQIIVPSTTVLPSGEAQAFVNVSSTTPGTFTYELIKVEDALGNICFQLTTNTAAVKINPIPVATLTSGVLAVCENATPKPTVTLTGSNGTLPYTFSYTINGTAFTKPSDAGVSTTTVEIDTNVPGSFVVVLTGVSDNSTTVCASGPITGQTATIQVNPSLTGSIASSIAEVCQGTTLLPQIVFTGDGGTGPYNFTYTVNGGTQITVPSTTVLPSGEAQAFGNVLTTTAGTFTYELIKIEDALGNICFQLTTNTAAVKINPIPVATIIPGVLDVCQNAPAKPIVTLSGSSGTIPYTFSYTLNGTAFTKPSDPGTNTTTVEISTAVAGNFTLVLTGVSDATATACASGPIAGQSVTVKVNPSLTGSIAASIAEVCQNSTPLPQIRFTGTGGTAPYTFTYTVNGGPQITTSNTVVNVATANPDTFNYVLIKVEDVTGNLCFNLTNTTATVKVNPLPTAVLVPGVLEVCQDETNKPIVIFRGADGTAPYTFSYTVNGTPYTQISDIGLNTYSLPINTNVPGDFIVTLTGVQDSSSTTCASGTITGQSVTIRVNAPPTIASVSFNNAEVCQGDAATVTAVPTDSSKIYTYTWTTPAGVPAPGNVASFSTTVAGRYSVKITDPIGCVSLVSFADLKVNPLPDVTLTDGFICVNSDGSPKPGAVFPLETGLTSPDYSFIWYAPDGTAIPASQGGTAATYNATAPGNYSVEITDERFATNCSQTFQATIVTSLPPDTATYTVSNYFSEVQRVTINVLPVGDYLYQLDNGAFQNSNEFVNLPSGFHTVLVKDKYGCSEGIFIENIRILNFPKFFTPNGDGYNDLWNVFELEDQPNARIMIYDRYGKLLKQISTKGAGWDGTFNGQALPGDDYWFIITFEEQGVTKEFKAHFALKR